MNHDEGFFDQLRKQHSPKTERVSGDRDSCELANEEMATQESEKEPEHNFRPLTDAKTDSSNISQRPDVSQSVAATHESGMPHEARRALVSLLRHGVILSAHKSKLFDSICRYQDDIRRHLADMYLRLVLDEKAGVSFVAGIDDEYNSSVKDAVFGDESEHISEEETIGNEEPVSLIYRRTLSIFDTLLLLILRKHYQERETSGEQKVVIDVERIESNLTPFLSLTNSSKSDRKRLNSALQKMVDRRILSSVRGSDDRYEITPIIRYVVNAEFLENMLSEYHKLGAEVSAGSQSDLKKSNDPQSGDESYEPNEQAIQ